MPDVSLTKSLMTLSEEEFDQLKSYHLRGSSLKELFTLDRSWTSEQLVWSIRLAVSASTAQDLIALARSLRANDLSVDEMGLLMKLSQGSTVGQGLPSDD